MRNIMKGLDIKNAAVMQNEVVKLSICTDHPVIPVQYLPISAQTAQKGGLPYYEALKSLTVNAAEILGIGDEVGTISVGKSADLQFYPLNMCPLDLMAEPVMVMIDGRIVKTK